MIEVIRVLVYEYDSYEDWERDVGRWTVPPEGLAPFYDPRTSRIKITSMVNKMPERTAKQKRVLDIANAMVSARNETARGVPTVAVIEPEGERRIDVPGAIDTPAPLPEVHDESEHAAIELGPIGDPDVYEDPAGEGTYDGGDEG